MGIFKKKQTTGPPELIRFHTIDEPYGAFANDAPYGVRIDNVTWPTVTHYMLSRQYPTVPEYSVRAAPSISEVHSLTDGTPERNKWDIVRDDFLRRALHAKFSQHLDLEEMIVGTGNMPLVYACPEDSYYGIGPDGNGHNMFGRLLMQARRRIHCEYSGVRTDWDQYIRSAEAQVYAQPKEVHTLIHLGDMYYCRGWYELSLTAARAIIGLEPDHEFGTFLLALSLMQLGRAEEAIEPLKLLTRLDPDYPDYFRTLSEAFDALGRTVPARIYARRARLIEEGDD